jgi:hypothetical protein
LEAKTKNENNPTVRAGRIKAVTTFTSAGRYVGVITEIIASTATGGQQERIRFSGPVTLDDRASKQVHATLIPIIDQISSLLGLPAKNFEISGVNLGSAASLDRGVGISGLSADLPILIALLSAALEVAIRQDVAATGHIASTEGDIRPVKGIPQKIEAAVSAPGVSAILIPALDKDRSFEVLTPGEYHSAMESVVRHKGDIRIHMCEDLLDAFKVMMPEDAVTIGSLKAGFFKSLVSRQSTGSSVHRAAGYLTEENEKRFWQAVGHSLLSHEVKKAHESLQVYGDFHVRLKTYPPYFGEKLSRLVISLPGSVRRLKRIFPLVPMDLCIGLSQLAGPGDHRDLRELFKAAFGEGFEKFPATQPNPEKMPEATPDDAEALLDDMLAEIRDETLARTIGRPLDEARGRYISSLVTVTDGFEFNEAITAFYTHLFQHTASPAGHADTDALSAAAIDLVEKAFQNEGGYKAALAEGHQGINGGMRKVFDAMTEYLKEEEKQKHIAMVLKKAIDSKDWDAKVRLMKIFVERVRPELPDDLKDMSPKQLASRWDVVIRHYAESRKHVADLLRRL